MTLDRSRATVCLLFFDHPSMCRWLVWVSGVPVMLEDVVLSPTNSLLVQSFEAGYIPGHLPTHLVVNSKLNADGFGLGWYYRQRSGRYAATAPDTAPQRLMCPIAITMAGTLPLFSRTSRQPGTTRTCVSSVARSSHHASSLTFARLRIVRAAPS